MQKTMRHDQLDLAEQYRQSKKQAIRYIQSQLVLTAVITMLLLFFDVVKAYSALMGGLIATISSAWFAYKVFRISPESAAETMLASAYLGEIYKIILIGALFLSAFILIKPLSAVVLLVSFFVIYISPILVSIISDSSTHQQGWTVSAGKSKHAGNGAGDTEIKRDNDG